MGFIFNIYPVNFLITSGSTVLGCALEVPMTATLYRRAPSKDKAYKVCKRKVKIQKREALSAWFGICCLEARFSRVKTQIST